MGGDGPRATVGPTIIGAGDLPGAQTMAGRQRDLPFLREQHDLADGFLALARPDGIPAVLDDEHPPALVPRNGDGINYHRLARDQLDAQAGFGFQILERVFGRERAVESESGENTKYPIPNTQYPIPKTKQTTSSKLQTSMPPLRRSWCLMLGTSLVFGFWCLVFRHFNFFKSSTAAATIISPALGFT